MQDEHFMKLWVEAHTCYGRNVDVADVLGSRLDALRERVGLIDGAYASSVYATRKLESARAHLARLFSLTIPVGVLAGVLAAAIATASGPLVETPTPAAHPTMVSNFTLPYVA